MEKEYTQKNLLLSKLTLDLISEMVFWIDCQGRFFLVNKSACENLEYAKEELLKLSVPDVDDNNTTKEFIEKWNETQKIGKVSLKVSFLTKTGRTFPAEITANFVEFEGGQYLCAVARKIASREEVEDTLIASEERYRTLFEAADDAIFLMDRKKFLECNDKTLEIYGCKEKCEIIGHSPWEFSPQKQPDGSLSIKKAKTLIKDALEGDPQKFYWKHTRLNGDEFDVEVSLNRMVIRDKKLLQAIVRDRTDELATLNALEESEEKFHKAFHNNPDSLHITSIPEGNFVEVNSLFQKLSGYTKEELIGNSAVDLGFYINTKDRENLFAELQEKGKLEDYEIIFKVRSGKYLLCRVFAEIVEIHGKPHLVSTVQDITDQKKAENALNNERNLLRSIIDSIPDHIYIKDTKHRFVISNASTLERFSVNNNEDIIGKTDLDFLDKSIAEEFHEEETELFRTGKPIINKLIKSREKDIWGLHSKFPLKDIHGNLIGLIGYNKDITQLKLAEIELQKEKDFSDKIINTVIDTIFVFDSKTGKPIRWNKAFNDVSGFTNDEINRKKAPEDWYSKEDLEKAANANDMMLNGENPTLEMSLITKTGNLVQSEYISSFIFDSDDNPQYIIAVGRDITERKKSEKALRESEEKFRTMVEASPDAVTTTDLEAKITFASSRTAEIHKYSNPAELIGMNAFELVVPEERERAVQNFILGFEKGVLREKEYTLCRKDGSTFEGEITGSVVKDMYGNPVGSILTSRDITQRKKNEKALIESEERYRLLIENIPTVAWKTNKDGVTTFISSNVEQVYGYSPDEIYKGEGRLFIDRIHQDDRELVNKSFQKLFEEGIEYNVEYRIKTKDGRWIWLNDRASIVQEEDDNQFSYGVFSDITERKLAENVIKEKEAWSRATVEAIPDLLFRLDHNGTYIDISGPEEDLFLPAKELMGKRFTDILPAEEGDFLMKEISKALKNNQFTSVEYSIPTMKGELQYFEGRISPINVNEVLFIARNITEKVEAEKEIDTYQANLRSMANELNLVEEKERRRIAVNLHDHLSQSLALAKINLTSIIKKNLSPDISEEIKETNRYITDAIERSRSITYELSPPVLYELGLSPAIQWRLDQIEDNFKIKTSVDVKSEIREMSEDVHILAFRSVCELINNVVKHAKASQIDIILKEEKGSLIIKVDDDGIGFNPEKKAIRVTKKGGFGLFSIQERLGYFNGKLEIASEMNKGTSVVITIPLPS